MILINPFRFGAGVGGGPATYFSTQLQGSGSPGTVYAQTGYTQFAKINVTTGGTFTKLELYENFGGSGNVKLALFNATTRALLASAAPVAVSGAGWISGTISYVGAAAFYYVGWLPDGATMGFEMDTSVAGGANDEGRSDGTESPVYATGLGTPLPANNNPFGGRATARIYVA